MPEIQKFYQQIGRDTTPPEAKYEELSGKTTRDSKQNAIEIALASSVLSQDARIQQMITQFLPMVFDNVRDLHAW